MTTEELAAAVDLLIGRSLAQDLAIQYLARHMPQGPYYPPLARVLEQDAHALRSGPWTDAQLAHFDQALREISQTLAQNLPAFDAPF